MICRKGTFIIDPRNITETVSVSVVIPTLNRGKMLAEALESVLLQSVFRNNAVCWEIIVVDDGSTDDTKTILKTCFPEITCIYQENQGVSAARNTGIRKAKGDFIAFLDSDDLWMREKLYHQIAFFDTCPEALICQTQEIWNRKGRQVNPKKKHEKPSGMIFFESLSLCLVSPSAVMMRKKFFDIVGLFDEDLPSCEDYDLWLRTSVSHPIYLVDIPLVEKRGGHPDQLSARPGLDRYRIASLQKLLDMPELSLEQRDAVIRTLCQKTRIYAAGCRKRGKTEEARQYEKILKAFSG